MNNIRLIVDIETTGFLNQGGKIVEIGIVKLNLDSGEITPAYNSLIKEPGFDILHSQHPLGWIFKNSDITYTDVISAPTLESQRDIIQFLFDKYYATAYNKEFDFGFLKNRNFSIKELPCPMLVATPIINLQPNPGFKDAKWPSVTEAWNYFFGNTGYLEKHRGLDDATHEAILIYEMYKRGIFKKKNLEKIDLDYNEYYTFPLQYSEVLTPELFNSHIGSSMIFDEKLKLIPSFNKTSWGYIDKNMNTIIPYQFDWADNFIDSIARVKKNECWGVIDLNGNEVVPIKYDWINSFSDGLAICCLNGTVKIINEYGKQISDIMEPPWGYNNYGEFHNGLAWVENTVDPKNPNSPYIRSYFGFINTNGLLAIDLKYYEAHSFAHGLASVRKNKKWGFINQLGDEIVPFEFDEAESFKNGLAKVRINMKWGIIDMKGKSIAPPIYDEIRDFFEGIAVVRISSLLGCINQLGKQVIPIEFDVIDNFKDGYALVRKIGKSGFIIRLDNDLFKINVSED
jgi:DNA polymerase III subunit epsilon